MSGVNSRFRCHGKTGEGNVVPAMLAVWRCWAMLSARSFKAAIFSSEEVVM